MTKTSQPTGFASIPEFFLLRHAREVARATPASTRDAVSRALRLSRQRHGAADALWAAGHPAEAIRLAAAALQAAVLAAQEAHGDVAIATASDEDDDEASSEAGDKPTEQPLDALLAARGLPSATAKRITEAHAEVAGASLPVLDSDIGPTHADLFRRALHARDLLDGALAPAAMTPGEIVWTRAIRWGATAAAVLAAIFALYLVLRVPQRATAQASAVLAGYPAENVADGDEATEWLLPNRTPGWIELTLDPVRDVGELRLLNSHNGHYNDRATRNYRIEVFSGGRVAKTLNGSFPAFSPNPEWQSVDVDVDDVDRIRIHVLTHHLAGGGLAEVEAD